MTKEELKQEFEKYFEQKNNEGYLFVSQEMEQIELKDDCEMVCLDFAEPREKRIAELEAENEELKKKLKPENCLKLLAKEGYIKFTSDQLTYAKTIIQDLLENTDEYARQRAEDFLKENK